MADTLPALPAGWQMLLNVYGFFLPFMLYAAWSTLAFWDLGRREDLGRATAVAWGSAVLVLPLVGAGLYLTLGRSSIPAYLRATVLAGGAAVYALFVVAGALVGGIA